MNGYYREPTVYQDRITFVADDALWTGPLTGGVPRQLTATKTFVSTPCYSPDGKLLAFIGRDDGYPEIYVMPAEGGPAERLTYLGSPVCRLLGWSQDGNHILFASNVGQPFVTWGFVRSVSKTGGSVTTLNYGPAASISFSSGKGVVLGRHGRDAAQWKRYRGGSMGTLWIDREGDGNFEQLLDLESNLSFPMWLGDRIYFFGDHEGYGNLYSCSVEGADLKRHTDHEEFYVRNPKTDGVHIVYHAGGDLYCYELATGVSSQIPIDLRAPRPQLTPRYVSCSSYLEDYDLHPQAHSVALVSRGKPFSMAHWEESVRTYGKAGGSVRYRLPRWLNDGRRLVTVSDDGGDEAFELYHLELPETPTRLAGMDIGRPIEVKVSPTKDQLVFSNQRQELFLLDLESAALTLLDRSDYGRILNFAYSPDGRWLAYSFSDTPRTQIIKIANLETRQTRQATQPVLEDDYPAWDPDGNYLYFIGKRTLDPVHDTVKFSYAFIKGAKPMLVTLRKDVRSPFVPTPKAPGNDAATESQEQKAEKSKQVEIDFDGIFGRAIAFPVDEGIYGQIKGAKGKVFYSKFPVEGTLGGSWFPDQPAAKGSIEVYDFAKQSAEPFVSSISSFDLSRSCKTLIYRAGDKVRVLNAAAKPDEKKEQASASRDSGWLDLTRVKPWINPREEWRQMYRETWRLLRDHYFVADMADVDWTKMYDRYLPLLERLGTRAELSDLLWELGGELGTSHAYEIGGDYPKTSRLPQGFLGVDYSYDAGCQGYRINKLVTGDPWNPAKTSPLAAPGMNVKVGDVLKRIDGVGLTATCPPEKLLINKGNTEVSVTIEDTTGAIRELVVKTLVQELPARLQDWIEANRRFVHEQTKGRVGYIYMSDMSPQGFSEFHRSFQVEFHREGLIVDVRNNSGGHISQMVLEKLAKKRLGYDLPRYGKLRPIPRDSLLGPIVALTDEFSGSDGDIFSHTYKMMGLGLLIGKRTWGGIVGLNPTHPLVDGTITTQPEFFNWFTDVHYNLENRGAEPHIIVEKKPQDYAQGKDPQLVRAVAEMTRQLEQNPPVIPEFGVRPTRRPPPLKPNPYYDRG